eukprot:CAMPEP_0172541594 /NCGR_PEP_ID=MMETSP1067-20121228/12375_1 /TAXON_ID=265564 ORGANISM="Thalassiosira punctigera, Strain Tpunct2005C2" /NCGR_SAMPLE_ID=MMETSP1067 /ASSEMBLY_ACC=CAM_ASM_000444 /LENGTH=1391 /DNA_ID=CAMNT_0013327663 /DNA_START=90 /DNA_END=4262 /DNA_ORIENTATION=-
MGGHGAGRKLKGEKRSASPRPAKKKKKKGSSAGRGRGDNSSGTPPVINVGDVGYTFRKQFFDGWYIGKVVKIRPGAGGYDRRCHYEDGDSEDLSLSQLQTLALLDPEVTKETANSVTKQDASKSAPSSSDDEDVSMYEHEKKLKKKAKFLTKRETSKPVDSSTDDEPLSHYRSTCKNSKQRVKITNDTIFKSANTARPTPTKAAGLASQSEEGESGGIRRSGRAVKAPRKVDEIYGYEHIKMSYSTHSKKKARVAEASTPEKKARLLSSTLEEIIPLDKAAESTLYANDNAENSGDLRSDKNETDDTEEGEEDGKWLEKVAASLGADTSAVPKKFRPVHRSSTPSSIEGPPVSTITCAPDNNPAKSGSGGKNDCDMLKQPPDADIAALEGANYAPLPLLSERDVGSRHGCLVFHKSDSRRKVAEVIFEKDLHWVEVAIDGALKSYRPSQLRVVPSNQFKEGDNVPLNFGKAPRRTSLSKKACDKSPILSPSEKKPPAPAVSVDYLFCWFCENCNANNKVLNSACHSCNSSKTPVSKRSILLEIAEKSIKKSNVKYVEEAMNNIPYADRPSIPERLIAHLLGAKTSGTDFMGVSLEPKDYWLEPKFYWCCGSCTMQNSFKRTTCSACLQAKGELAERSPLMKIAEEASKNSKTITEALSLVAPHERPLMPKVVMDVLVTCIFTIEGKNGQSRRCRKQKKDGYDFCEAHCDPILLSQPRADPSGSSVGTPVCNSSLSKASTGAKSGPLSRIAAISDYMPSFLRDIGWKANDPGMAINSIEDAVLCGENAAFPLGMKVRKFFEGYGFHDGRIVKVARKLWDDDNMKKQRPVLVYRLKYNDGDQEDFLHHEISSLTQIYDRCNVYPEAPPEDQIQPGAHFETRFGAMKIIGHKTPPGGVKGVEGGTVIIQFQDSSKEVEIDLLKLQLAVLRKMRKSVSAGNSPTESIASPLSSEDKNKTTAEPVLEWPGRGPNSNDDESIEEDDRRYDVCEGLSLHRRRCIRSPCVGVARFPMTSSALNNPCDVRPGCNFGMWDPAGCFDHLSWDPYASTVCETCGIDKDDNQVVICDECHRGFHTYCMRPVMVNIPSDDWICSACCGRSDKRISFEDFSEKLRGKHHDILKYLGLHKKYKTPSEFLTTNSEAIGLFSLSAKKRAISQQVQARHVVYDVGNIKFLRAPEKNDWILPTPLLSEEDYTSSILSMAAAMQYCGMKSYSVDHIYSGDVNEKMNDPALEVDEITPMSRRNISIFKAYRHNTREGVFPPVQIIHDESFGFSVKALACMQRHTIIGEYLGEIVTMEKSHESNSDSLMVLLDTGDPKTSLIIDPTCAGNIARFLSGINNRSLLSKRKVNVRTRRFFMDGKVHVCLFTSRRVEAGEILNYDYNAGNEGKDVDQW